MNTNAIFNPEQRLQAMLQEAQEEGVTRLEISYYADSFEAQAEYFADDFAAQARQELYSFQLCLNKLKGVCFRLPLVELF